MHISRKVIAIYILLPVRKSVEFCQRVDKVIIVRTMSNEIQADLRVGPDPSVTYPIQVHYCGNCSLPIEVNTSFLMKCDNTNPLTSEYLLCPNLTSNVIERILFECECI